MKTIVEKKSTTNFEFVFYRKIDFEYDSQERVILQRRSDVILNKFSTKDTLFEISTDSIEVQYETNEKGIILLNTEWSKGDTLLWTIHPFPLALFSFGEKEAVYLRTVPMERNTTLFYATGTTAVISRNADGLMIKKEQNFENSKDEYVKTKPSVTYIYSYVFREDRE